MSHIVVTLDPMQDGGSACAVARAPYAVPNPNLVAIVRLDDLFGISGPDAVRQVGERLAEKIRQNTTVDAVLGQALMTPALGCLPICFRVGDPEAHALSWEALVGNDQFVGLDDRWPIARIARGGTIPDGARKPFAPPLKLAVVLSAVGLDGMPEWQGLAAAIQAARDDGLQVAVTLYAAEEHVIDAARAMAGVDAQPIPTTATALITTLRELEPHLVHFFCHGAIASGVRRLELGTVRDFDEPERGSSILLRVDELGVGMAQADTWGVVLNMCRGAEAVDESVTHAEEIVSSGVPVAIGHRRLIDAADASAFSASFYPALFRAVGRALAAPEGQRVLQWPYTLVEARRVLRDNHGADPARNDSWTVPVLYTRTGTFELIAAHDSGVAAATQALGEHDTVGGIVDALSDSAAPPGLLADLRGLMPGGP